VSLNDLYREYHDRVQFLLIYIREAHPVDGWWLGDGIASKVMSRGGFKAATDVHDPKTIEERRAVAGRCEDTLQNGIRTYVDEMDDRVNQAYAASPTRLYLVGLDGRWGPGTFWFQARRAKGSHRRVFGRKWPHGQRSDARCVKEW
jgi:hypothetical protein